MLGKHKKTVLPLELGFQMLLKFQFSQFSSVTQLCPNLCNPMNCSMPGLMLIADSEVLTRLLQLTISVEHLQEVSSGSVLTLLWQDLGQLLGVWAGLVTWVHFLVPAGGDHR